MQPPYSTPSLAGSSVLRRQLSPRVVAAAGDGDNDVPLLAVASNRFVISGQDGRWHPALMAALTSLEISRGKSRSRGAGKGALWGAIGLGCGHPPPTARARMLRAVPTA